MRYWLTIILTVLIGIAQSQVLKEVWATDKILKTPESVYYNEQQNEIYVSNINGKPTDKDGNGFISLLDTTGTVKSLEWVKGFDAPKGMGVRNDSLIVSDIDRIHIVSIEESKIIQTIKVEGASFLNDILILADGSALITDMTEDKIMILKDGKVDTWLEDTLLIKPNGLEHHKKNIVVGVKNSVISINAETKEIKVLVDETGPVDGLIHLSGNKFIISDWAGRIMQVNPSEKVVLSNTTEENMQAADLGYIPDKKWVLIPTFFDNRVIASQLY
jgi:DNA-binding beta-propeller fold protein YncE